MGRTIFLTLALVAALLISVVFVGGCATAEEGDYTTTIYMVIFLVLIFGVFYFLIIRPQRKRQQGQQQLLSDLRPGDRVITIGSIYGRIESLREDSIVLKVESGATIRFARNSIAGKQGEPT